MGRRLNTPEFSVGQKLRELRRSRDVTLESLAERADLSASFLSQIERGRAGASLSSLQRIADALEVPIAEILEQSPTSGPLAPSVPASLGMTMATPSQRLHVSLRDAIVSGQLRPGEQISEETLAAFGDVSRTAMRMTLRELHNERLIYRTTDGAYAVSGFGPDELADLCTVRTNLEELAARRAAASASATEIAQLRRRVEGQHESFNSGHVSSPQEMADDDDQFHESLWMATRNRYLVEQLRPMRALIRSFGLPAATNSDIERSIFDHLAVVEALEHRDSDAAGAAMRRHHDREDKLRLSARVSVSHDLAPGTSD